MLRPTEITDCFNIFVLHQNRAKHDEYTYIPQNKLPKFLNLIIWGHEHECRITPEFIPDVEYFISQPGISQFNYIVPIINIDVNFINIYILKN